MLAFRSLDPFRALREPDRRRRDEERLSRSEQRTLSKNPKQPLDRKSPIQVRIHFPPAASRVRTGPGSTPFQEGRRREIVVVFWEQRGPHRLRRFVVVTSPQTYFAADRMSPPRHAIIQRSRPSRSLRLPALSSSNGAYRLWE